jgi:hypothetical protein
MSLTVIMTWDIRPGMEQDYFQFVVSDWIPATRRIGLQVTAAWYAHYRDDDSTPMIRVEAVANTADEMRQVLSSDDWQDILARLDKYVTDYQQKVVETTGEFLI